MVVKYKKTFKHQLYMVRLRGTIKRWGNSYGILLPKRELEENKLREGQEVTIDLRGRYDFADLFGSCSFKESVDEIMRDIDEGYDD